MMKKFSERNAAKIGIVGAVALGAALAVGLNINAVHSLIFGTSYSALFAEAGGIAAGNPVLVAGHEIGSVEEVSLAGAHVEVEFTITNDEVELGKDTSAAVSVVTVLGERALTLTSRGSGELSRTEPIPVDRTTAAYTLPDVLNTLTDKAADLDVGTITRALETITKSTEGISPDLQAALDGVTRLSATINSRDKALLQLFERARSVSGTLSERAEQFQVLLADANKLLAEAQRRRAVIETLFQNVSTMANQISGLVADNREDLRPTLDRLNSVLKVLKDNEDNLKKIISGASSYVTGLGEAVGSGPFFSAFIANLVPPGNLVPPELDLSKLAGPKGQGGN